MKLLHTILFLIKQNMLMYSTILICIWQPLQNNILSLSRVIHDSNYFLSYVGVVEIIINPGKKLAL